MSRADAVLIAVNTVDKDARKTLQLLGSGTRTSANTILTGAHVLNDCNDGYFVRIESDRRSRGQFVDAQVVWRDDALDVAVLRTAPESLDDRRPFGWKIGVEQSESSVHWECSGYPMVRADTPSETVEQVAGTACSCGSDDEHLNLDAAVEPGEWQGISGGGVWFGDRLGGVMRAVPFGWNGRRIQAVPVARFLRVPEFREAAGLPLVETETRAIECLVRDLFAEWPALKLAVAHRFKNTPSDEAALAKFLVDKPVADLAVCFNHVDESLKNGSHDRERDALRSIVARLLPYAADIRQVIADAGAVPEALLHTLPIKSATWAELIVAGLEEREARFRYVPRGNEPPGISAIVAHSLPNARVPIIDGDGSGLALAVMHHIAEEEGIEDPDDLAGEVGILLRYQRNDATPEDPPPYYVLVDQRFGETWAVVVNSLARRLPDLCLVHLPKQAQVATLESERRTGKALNSAMARKNLRD